ncbi:hypothetical protein [Giesbergeria anulus]|uniref:hypothetical protein n=1 Tax=Giesbergeria anulus TaxID=180197 RepID=UPI001C4301B2|nr:hypothetical protein [Giesbergeria anulus]
MREFARRNTPSGSNRVKFNEAEFERMKNRVEGVCYQGEYCAEPADKSRATK